jgi:hypothetical protein
MARPYQHIPRADIAAKLQANQLEQSQNDLTISRIEAERSAADPARQSQLTRFALKARQELQALIKEKEDLEYELHVRNSPELVALLGAGTD